MLKNPLVSICCITYNHEKYIRECLEGFVLQKTNFDFEILIFDDASIDNTQEIILDYTKDKNNVKTFLQTKNQWNKKKYGLIGWLFPAAKGKYIALCEGDDYWTDPLKLQKQVDLLETNPNLVACHHWQKNCILKNSAFVEVESPKEGHGYYPQPISNVVEIFSNNLRIKARTVMFRNVIDENFFPKWFYKVVFGDVPLSFLLGKFGDFGFIDEEMAVYRQTETGVSKAGLKELGLKSFKIQHFKNWIDIWDYANVHYNYKFDKESVKTVTGFYKVIFLNTEVSFFSFLKMLNYNLFERNLSVLKTYPHTKMIFLYYLKGIGGKVKRKLLYK